MSLKDLTVKEFADLLSVGECTVYRWISEDVIQYVNCRIPKGYANRVKRLWDKTCTPSEFARHLGVSPSKIDLLISKGKLRSIRVIKKPRLFLKDVRKIKNDPDLVQPEDVLYKNRRGFARYTKKRKFLISLLGNTSKKRDKGFVF